MLKIGDSLSHKGFHPKSDGIGHKAIVSIDNGQWAGVLRAMGLAVLD